MAMTYDQALKKVQARKSNENMMMIKVSYDSTVVLPYKDGLVLLGALTNAESYKSTYGHPVRISSFDKDSFIVNVLSFADYQQIKIAELLNVSVDELKQAQKEAEAA